MEERYSTDAHASFEPEVGAAAPGPTYGQSYPQYTVAHGNEDDDYAVGPYPGASVCNDAHVIHRGEEHGLVRVSCCHARIS